MYSSGAAPGRQTFWRMSPALHGQERRPDGPHGGEMPGNDKLPLLQFQDVKEGLAHSGVGGHAPLEGDGPDNMSFPCRCWT